MLQQLFKAPYVLPRPYAPIILLGRGPCGRVSKAEEKGQGGVVKSVRGVGVWGLAEELF